jgi:hypothetical protein
MSEMNPLSARKQGRREFLKAGGAVTAALLTPSAALADMSNKELPGLPSNPRTPAARPRLRKPATLTSPSPSSSTRSTSA